MKKFLAKVFFTGDCARGALFSLTLLTIGNGLWFLFLHMAVLVQGNIFVWWFLPTLGIGVLVITLYALAAGLCALVRLIVLLWRRRTLRPLWRLFPAGVFLAMGGIGFVRTFPPLDTALVWLSGEDYLPIWGEMLDRFFPPLAPAYWAPIFLLSLVLLAGAGLMLAAVFAAAEEKKFRAVFGKATLTLWGLLAAWYFITLGMALYESRRVVEVREAIERRFGRPLTAAGMEALYREGGAVDADFWERQEEWEKALSDIRVPVEEEATLVGSLIRLPDRPSVENLAWYGRFCREHRALIEAWERSFDRVPPLPVRAFPPGRLDHVGFPEYTSCRDFVQMERNRLILALSSGDAEAAWACYRRMGNVAAVPDKVPHILGSLYWIHIEGNRLDGMEKLLESRLLADARLDELESDLAELEREIPRIHLLAMYAEAACIQDDFMSLEDGLVALEGTKGIHTPGAFAPYRWILPPFWYHAALDKRTMLQKFLLPDFTFFTPPPEGFLPLVLSGLRGPALISPGYRFYALTARTRGMQVLLRAEKYRRGHGVFPQTLDDLPEDPLTSRPMIYEVGPAEIHETVWKDPANVWGNWEETTVDAVQVRSDPETACEKDLRKPNIGIDMTRAVIRLWSKAAGEAQTR